MKNLAKLSRHVSLLLGTLLVLAACTSTPLQRSDDAANSMGAVEKDIRQAKSQIDLVNP